MIVPIKHILNSKRIILASSSPRRSEILNKLGINFEVVPSNAEEDLNPNDYPNPGDFVIDTAFKKVEEVYEKLKNDANPPDIIIGADTIVVCDKEKLGKPKDKLDAFNTLKKLSGRTHSVYTGVIIKMPERTEKFYDKTDVLFNTLSDDVINGYIDTGEPMGRAGSYAIQNLGGTFVESIQGDFYTVVGLPLHKFSKILYELFKLK